LVDLESAHKAHERSQATLATLRAERAECAAKLDAAGTRIDQLKYEELWEAIGSYLLGERHDNYSINIIRKVLSFFSTKVWHPWQCDF
jgi:hypothetical protein